MISSLSSPVLTKLTVNRRFLSGMSYKILKNESSNLLEIHLHTNDNKSKLLPFIIDFSSPSFTRRLKQSHTELINKALGKKSSIVIDFTAGLGRDSLLMAANGKRVIMCERDPTIGALLSQALDDLEKKNPMLRKNLYLIQKDLSNDSSVVNEVLETWKKELCNDFGQIPFVSCYLDPMYPEKPSDRKAASKKDTQILHAILGDPIEDNFKEHKKMFSVALSLSSDKIIVKRSLNSPLLLPDLTPHHTISGSSQRFDIYLKDSMKSSENEDIAS